MKLYCNSINGLKAIVMMLIQQIVTAGVNVFYKLAANDGMSLRVLVAYRFIFAAAFVLPLALYLDRNRRPKLTWTVLLHGFLCALFGGTIAQNLYTESLVLTSATFASAMANLVPAITFVLAILFRLERLEFDKVEGKAKVVGTFLGIGGAMLLTFYKGLEIKIWPHTIDLLHKTRHPNPHMAPSHKDPHNQILGASLSLLASFASALSLIFQAKMSASYPCSYSCTALISVLGSIQAIVLAVCMDKDMNKWKLGWNIRLLAVGWTGTLASGIMVIFITWCVRTRGPLFVSIFMPLVLVIVAVAGSLLLDEKLYLGSVLGAIVIVCGLYMVLWAKGKEIKTRKQLIMSSKISKDSKQKQLVIEDTTTDDSIDSCSLVPENNKYSTNVSPVSPHFIPLFDHNGDDNVCEDEFSLRKTGKETIEDEERNCIIDVKMEK